MNLVALKPVESSVGSIVAGQAFTAADADGLELIARGSARRADEAPKWSGIRWPGATVVILASGPSLTVEQCEAVQVWRESAGDAGAAQMRRCIAINTTFRRAPWADVLYACDAPWWKLHIDEVLKTFRGDQLWTQDELAMRSHGINRVRSAPKPGLSKEGGLIHTGGEGTGGNSGYQAVNLAYQAGAKRLVLLGFDMNRVHGAHWHGNHPVGLPSTPPHLFTTWIRVFDGIARDLATEGVEVVNCSPGSALKCFRTADLAAALA